MYRAAFHNLGPKLTFLGNSGVAVRFPVADIHTIDPKPAAVGLSTQPPDFVSVDFCAIDVSKNLKSEMSFAM